MTEIIMHVFSKKDGSELAVSRAFSPNTRTRSFITDLTLGKTTEGILTPNKTLEQDFIDRIIKFKAKAIVNPPCTLDTCLWCKDCYNRVCDGIGRTADKIP